MVMPFWGLLLPFWEDSKVTSLSRPPLHMASTSPQLFFLLSYLFEFMNVMIGFMDMRFTRVFLCFFFLSFFGYMHDTHGLLMVAT